ncbi:hypothetical protein CLU79DRAFT_766288, partial [Phycomyces nitens]
MLGDDVDDLSTIFFSIIKKPTLGVFTFFLFCSFYPLFRRYYHDFHHHPPCLADIPYCHCLSDRTGCCFLR